MRTELSAGLLPDSISNLREKNVNVNNGKPHAASSKTVLVASRTAPSCESFDWKTSPLPTNLDPLSNEKPDHDKCPVFQSSSYLAC